MESESTYTPRQLADELGVQAKSIRTWLRKVEMRSEVEKGSRWQLTASEAEYVRREFST